jgi:hypothetical protein
MIAVSICTVSFLTGCDYQTTMTGPDTKASHIPDTHIRQLAGSHPSGTYSRYVSGNNHIPHNYFETLITVEQGGTLTFRNGQLQVLPFSIDETKVIGARTYSLHQGDFFKKIYEFEPSGTHFDPDAVLVLRYCDLGPYVPETLVLRVFNENTQQWEIASYMVNDPDARTFTGPIEHFSRYSLSGNRQILEPQTSP